jgi:hypothetical protein
MALALAISVNTAQAADLYVEQVQELVVSGYLDSWIGASFLSNVTNGIGNEIHPDHDSYMTTGQNGRLSLPLSDVLAIQTDINNEFTSNAFRSNAQDDFSHSLDFGVHLSARDPSRGLFGVFGAFGQGKGDNSDSNGRQNYWAIGGEAQFYADNTTFYVQGGYLDSEPRAEDGDSDGLHDAFFIRGVARWFMTPDSRLQGEIAYADGKQDSAGIDTSTLDMQVIQWGARYDTVISEVPLIGDTAVFVGYRGTYFDNDCCGAGTDSGRFTEHTIMAGVSYHFGGMTLLDFDRVGATLELPTFGRWVAGGEQID